MKNFTIVLVSILGTCFIYWQTNQIYQLNHARKALNNCVLNAEDIYNYQFNEICRQNKKPANCWLNRLQYNAIMEERDKKINMCAEMFKYNH